MEEPFSPMVALPLELLERIADFAQAKDLLSLRRTCKTLDVAAFTHFRESYFTEPAYLLNCERSMATLRSVSAHPIFGRSVRKVYLTLWDVPDSWEDYLEHSDPSEVRGNQADEEFKRNLESLVERREEFWDGPLEKCLTDTFLNFIHLDNIPAIVIAGEEFEAPWGMAKRISLLAKNTQYCENRGIYYDFLVEAVKEAKYPLTHFEGRVCEPSVRMNQLSLALAEIVQGSLTTLKLAVATLDSYSESELDENRMDDIIFLGFLAECEGVESFSLSFQSQWGATKSSDDLIFNSIASTAGLEELRVFPRLQTLELDRQYIQLELIVQFLFARAPTLQVVRLRYINDDPDTNRRTAKLKGRPVMQGLWKALDGDNKTDLTLDLRDSYGTTMCWQTEFVGEKLADSISYICGLSLW